jgi:hypothetical protein
VELWWKEEISVEYAKDEKVVATLQELGKVTMFTLFYAIGKFKQYLLGKHFIIGANH